MDTNNNKRVGETFRCTHVHQNDGVAASISENHLEEWLTTKAAAKYLGISEAALRNMTSARQVPFYKLGRRNRYRVSELRELILSNRKEMLRGN